MKSPYKILNLLKCANMQICFVEINWKKSIERKSLDTGGLWLHLFMFTHDLLLTKFNPLLFFREYKYESSYMMVVSRLFISTRLESTMYVSLCKKILKCRLPSRLLIWRILYALCRKQHLTTLWNAFLCIVAERGNLWLKLDYHLLHSMKYETSS